MKIRFATSVLALTLAAAPMIAQTTGTTAPATDTTKTGNHTKVREAAASAQDATALSNVNKANIQDLKKRVAALEAEVKALQDSSKR